MKPGDEKTVKQEMGDSSAFAVAGASTIDHTLTARRFSFFREKYEFLGVIGEGGMGVVYKARQIHLDRLVAIKTLHSASFSEQALKRFEREAKAASGLLHPNLITIRDYGVDNEGQPYMVFDFIDGLSLSEMIRQKGQLELDKALDVFIQVAKGLSYAHDRGVLHRDIKPGNIIISRDYREVKIVDFGIAKVLDTEEGGQKLTQTGEVFGTPLYMSPEQSAGKRLDARSDLYSMGCVMFEALTATPPLVGESAVSTIMKHQTEIPPSLREASLGKEFPPDLELIVAKLLAKNPADRYQKANALIEDLNSIRHPAPKVALTQSAQPRKPLSRRSVLTLAAILVAVTSLILGTATVMKLSHQNQPKASPPHAKQRPPAPKFNNETTALDFSGQRITRSLVTQINQYKKLKELVWHNATLVGDPLKWVDRIDYSKSEP